MERAYMFLEEKEWKKASEYADKLLDVAPRKWEAHLIKLLADYHCVKKEALINSKKSFEKNINYTRVILYGDDSIKEELQLYINAIKEREKKKTLENEEKKKNAIRLGKKMAAISSAFIIAILGILYLFGQIVIPSNKYAQAEALLNSGEYDSAIDLFIDIYYYKDSSERASKIMHRNYLEFEKITISVPCGKEYSAWIENKNEVHISREGDTVTIGEFFRWCPWKYYCIKDYDTKTVGYGGTSRQVTEILDLWCYVEYNSFARYRNQQGEFPDTIIPTKIGQWTALNEWFGISAWHFKENPTQIEVYNKYNLNKIFDFYLYLH